MADTVGSLRAVFTIDNRPLTQGLKSAAKEISAFKKRYGGATDIELKAEYKDFLNDLKVAGRAVSSARKDFARGATLSVKEDGVADVVSALDTVKKTVNNVNGQTAAVSVKEDGATKTVAELAAVTKAANKANGQKVEINVDKDGSGAAALDKFQGGLHNVATSLRDVAVVGAGTVIAPALIAGIGALPAVATAASGAAGQLGLALGQGMVGAVAIGETALQSARLGLLAYTKIISGTISASRELYLQENKAAQARIDAAKKTAFSTKANMDFNRSLDDAQIGFIKLQGAVADKTFPFFTKEIRAWTNLLPKFQKDIVGTAGGLAKMASGFSHWVRSAKDGQVLGHTIEFINSSTLTGGRVLSNMGKVGLLTFQHMIAPATKLQNQVLALSVSMRKWVDSTKGAHILDSIIATLQHRFYQLLSIVKNVGSGLIGVFTALNNQGGVDKLMNGVVGLSRGFANLMKRGNGARAAIVEFMNDSNPLMNQLWRLTKTVVIQFGLLAKNVIEAGQSGGKMGTLAKVIESIRKSIKPLRQMVQNTFIALGPILAKLIPQAAKFLSVFLGDTGPLNFFLKAMTNLLRIFNRMPDGVKTAIVNLIALKSLMGNFGISAFVGGIAHLASQMYTLRTASNAAKKSQVALALAQGDVTKASEASGGAAVASGTKFGRLKSAIAGAAKSTTLLKLALIGTGIGAALVALGTAGVIIYKNWSKIKGVFAPVSAAFKKLFNTIGPFAKVLRESFAGALKAVASGLLSAVVPGKHFGEQVHNLSKSFGKWLQTMGPPLRKAMSGVSRWLNDNRGTIRAVAHIVGTVLVSGFKVWGFVLRNTGRLIVIFVKQVGRIISAFRAVVKFLANAAKSIVGSIRNFTKGGTSTIKSFGSTIVNFWKKRIWQPVANFLMNIARGMLKTLSNWKNSAVNWVKGLVPSILNFWKKRVWQPAADFLADKSKGMRDTLSNWLRAAVNWVKSLPSKIGNAWHKFWQNTADFLVNRSDGMRNTLGNWLNSAVNWVRSLPSKIGKAWHNFWQGMADWVVKIKDGILNTMGNLVSGVQNAWKNMAEFTNKILSALGLKKDDTKPIPSPGPTKGTINAPGGVGGTNRPGAARGGLTSGTQADAWRQFTEYQMARGGQPPRGGMADGKEPRLVYGEAGPEAYVTLGRYTRESAEALTKANEIWTKKGWLEKARRDRVHRRRGEEDQRPGGKWGQGYSVSPVTHYDWVPTVASKVHAIADATGTKPNTYPGHGEPGGSSEKYTADFWGAGGRGSPISKSMGYKTADLAINKYNHDPGVLYVIRQGEYWRGGHWQSNTYGDPHFDHTHVSWDSPGGAKATGTPSRPNPKQAKFEKMWHETIDPWGKKWVARMSPASQLHRGAGAGTSKGVGSIYDWIDAKIPDMIGGSSGSLPSGSSPKGLTIGEALSQGGWPDSQLIKGSSTIWHESRGNAHAQNPSGARGLMQIMPQTAKGVGASYDKLYDPVYNTSTGLKVYNQAGGWGPWVGAGMGGDYRNKKVTGYGKGGIIGRGKRMELHLERRVSNAFHAVADTLRHMAGRRLHNMHIGDRGGVGTGKHVVGITNEAGPEAIIPLGQRTHQGRQALHAAERVYGNRAHTAERDMHATLKRIENHLDHLRKNGFDIRDKEALLAMADRYQGSPAGGRRFATNMTRFATRELKKVGHK